MEIDVTDKIRFGFNNDEYLPITKCVCGENYCMGEWWIHIDPEAELSTCDKCGAKFYFKLSTRVIQVIDDSIEELRDE